MHILIVDIHTKCYSANYSREPFLIDIHPSFTIKQAKDKIVEHINVPSIDQFLSFGGRTLEDDRTVASYDGIKDGSALWMVIFPNVSREKYRVFVSIHTTNDERKIIDLDIFFYDTVAQVKQAIYERTSILPENQRIIFAGKQIEDARVFSNYGIMNGSTVHLVIKKDI